jgi:fructose-1,6-bisphosphatase/inositol monophosphatase family enzyme
VLPADATPDDLLALFDDVVGAVADALAGQTDWALAASGSHAAQYAHDRTADDAALAVLHDAGVAVLSEESGHSGSDHRVVVVVDPVDGSTNASRRLPWWSTSLCAVDAAGPWVALVHDHGSGLRYTAVRRRGATVTASGSSRAVVRPAAPPLGGAVLSVAGWPPRHGGWAQFRAYGSLALELCHVASGELDGHVQFVCDEVAPWDYLAGALVCAEAGACVVDAFGRDLVVLDHAARRTPVAGGSRALCDELAALRRSCDPRPTDRPGT